jgi:diphthine-ammonia ligase
MCGIIGVCHDVNASKKVMQALALLKNRGRDGVGIATNDKVYYAKNVQGIQGIDSSIVLGHTLHAIVGHVPQPLQDSSNNVTLTSNCEIYNWEELNVKYNAGAKNDTQFLLWFLTAFGVEKISLLDGVYAFAYLKGTTLTIARDIIGVKPLFYSHTLDSFAFCSEQKVLENIGYVDIKELNPRQFLVYDTKNHTIQFKKREFFSVVPEHTISHSQIKIELAKLLESSIQKRIPAENKKIGLLFSGGIDSTFIAHTLQKLGVDFTCYTTVLDTQTAIPEDLIYAEKVAKEFNLTHRIRKISLKEIKPYLKKIVPLIEDTNVVKVGVALTFYLAAEMAKEDGCKVLFSGLGSEEIFAGYERHKKSDNINKECISGLLKMYERDLYRDDVISMDNSLELRVPFLDSTLVEYSLKIPQQFKIVNGVTKYILREIALSQGISSEFAMRKKKAAQYGSRIDNAIGRLAKKDGKKKKSEYLTQFYPSHNLKLGVLFSSGKDSNYATYIMKKQNYDISCLITLHSENPHSYMFQSVGVDMAKLQSQTLDIPLLIQKTKGIKEEELKDLHTALVNAKQEYKIDGVVTGAMFSVYQRDRIEKVCDSLGLKIFSPLWHKTQEVEMRELLQLGFSLVFVVIAAQGLDSSWLGREITLNDVEKLAKLRDTIGLNCAGEGGEFESVVLDGPLFSKKIILDKISIVEEKEHCAHVFIKKAHLEEKE